MEKKLPTHWFKFLLIGIFPHLLSLYWFIFHSYGEAVMFHTIISYPILFLGTKKWGWAKYRVCLHLFSSITFVCMLIGHGDILFFLIGILGYGILVTMLFMFADSIVNPAPPIINSSDNDNW